MSSPTWSSRPRQPMESTKDSSFLVHLLERLRIVNLETMPMSEKSKMSQWQQLGMLQDSMPFLRDLYGEHFSLEVRHFLADWIEEQPWYEVQGEPGKEKARALMANLVQQMHEKSREMQSGSMGMASGLLGLRLEEHCTYLQAKYGHDPMELVKLMCHLLKEERAFVESRIGTVAIVEPDSEDAITTALQQLNNFTRGTEELQKQEQQKQENFFVAYQDHHRRSVQINQLPATEQSPKLQEIIDNSVAALRNQLQDVINGRILLVKRFGEVVEQLTKAQTQVLDIEMISWKRRQSLAGNGSVFDNNISQLQKWCEDLADLIWRNRQMMKRVIHLCTNLPAEDESAQAKLGDLQEKITALLSSLVTSTFLVETQPPQVLKKDAIFSASVRLLVGGKLNVFMTPPNVEASIINERQARELLDNDPKARSGHSGDILNNTGPMEYNQSTGVLSINFKNMRLKSIKRADKKGGGNAENVTAEKFCILFQSSFNVGSNELLFQVWTLSLPIVVIVHGNQECAAMGTIFWDNAFAEPGRVPFHVPETVVWNRLAEQLDAKFHSYTGRGLDKRQLDFLASKLLGTGVDYRRATVTRTQFFKDNLPGRQPQNSKQPITFWIWLHSTMKLIKDHLKGPWVEGSIVGFVGKLEAQEILQEQPNGTFLLRFSESEAGAVTIAWTMDDPVKLGHKEVWHLSPFSEADLKKHSLPDRIKDMGQLIYLHPCKNKAEAFGKWYTPSNPTTTNGYIQAVICNKVLMPPSSSPVTAENPHTPQAMPSAPSPPPFSVDGDADGHMAMDTSAANGLDALDAAHLIFDDLDTDDLIAFDYNSDDIVTNLYANAK